MTKETRGNNRNGRRGNPNQDVQPLLGWIAAMLVVVIVVVAVALGMQRTGDQRNNAAEVRMTPVVGGMQVPVATETSAVAAASEVTPLPEAISNTNSVTMVTVITATTPVVQADALTMTGEMSPTAPLEMAEDISTSEEITSTNETTPAVEATAEPTIEPTVEPTVEAPVEPTADPTAEATVEPSATLTPRPTSTPRPPATARPTATSTVVVQNLVSGDTVVASGGRAQIYSDASLGSLILDSVGNGVPLEVLDPSGDYERYPVVVDGHDWVRVRAADGLVGWVMTDQVEAQ